LAQHLADLAQHLADLAQHLADLAQHLADLRRLACVQRTESSKSCFVGPELSACPCFVSAPSAVEGASAADGAGAADAAGVQGGGRESSSITVRTATTSSSRTSRPRTLPASSSEDVGHEPSARMSSTSEEASESAEQRHAEKNAGGHPNAGGNPGLYRASSTSTAGEMADASGNEMQAESTVPSSSVFAEEDTQRCIQSLSLATRRSLNLLAANESDAETAAGAGADAADSGRSSATLRT
jgi:hypothetical protein